MPLCGSQNCGCAFAGSATITVTGSGTTGDPYVFEGTVAHSASIEVFTANGTWVKPAGLAWIEVEVQGGGGGGGGAAATDADECAVGCGGGAGGYVRGLIAAIDLGATEAVTVGASGVAGAAGANAGGPGGASSFGSHCTGNGGSGGGGGSPFGDIQMSTANGGGGGGGTGGDIVIPGGDGFPPFMAKIDRVRRAAGGASHFHGQNDFNVATSGAVGSPGSQGSGGGGAANAQSQAARAGGIAGNGLVVVREYF